MAASRQDPSARYRELLEQYRRLHREGDPRKGVPAQNMFSGISLPLHINAIKGLVVRTGARTILDYGSGKGAQYLPMDLLAGGRVKWRSVQEYWGVDSIHCYDPAFEPYATLPSGRFHGVVCTDVLEHCPVEDLAWIVAELFGYAERFVFANVACYPALKTLPNGENAHTTVQSEPYWRALFESTAARHPDILWELSASVLRDGRPAEQSSGNSGPADSLR